jgi:hypothetical protein
MKCTGVAGRAFPDGEFLRRNPVISVVPAPRLLFIHHSDTKKEFAFRAWRSSMSRKYLSIVVVAFATISVTGCQATRTTGRKVGQAAVAIPIFDSDETVVERDQRERRERQWKQHWRDHPNDNPAMHDAFKDDYE